MPADLCWVAFRKNSIYIDVWSGGKFYEVEQMESFWVIFLLMNPVLTCYLLRLGDFNEAVET